MGESKVNHDNASLAALIGSRICHDLISPIGAISNGLELLELSGAIEGPEMGLIADSVGNAGARIRFFRIAYGAASTQMLGEGEILSVLDDLGRGGRLEVDWRAQGDWPRAQVRLAFLALQCCETALPAGGRVLVTEDAGHWTVIGSGPRIGADPDLFAGLPRTGEKPGLTPALVQFALLPEAAAAAGRRVDYALSPDRIVLSF